jgi:hypothetical protein
MQVVRWQLELGNEVIAQIDADEYVFPFTYGTLVESPEFERFRRFFTDCNDWPDDDEELEALCGEVGARGNFVVRDMCSGVAYAGVCLNHSGGQVVWFRHGDPA